IFGIRAIAFSQVLNGVEPTYEKQKPYIAEVIRILIDGNQPRLVNVNLPNEPVGLRWTHQSIRQYNGKVVKGEDPNGRQHCWFSATPLTTPDEGSDRWAIDRGLVSLTPLRLGLTDESWLEKLSGVQAGIT
ncbi:MAG: 5'/3'-nucleotidase SurE, partial [Anaerolineae bacterium]|nr:5'/3'-nucleotidase SurE [Anaerolineae bacterium]